MAIDHISPQQPHWDRNVNEVVDAVNTLMGGVEPTHLTHVFTYVNGVVGKGSQGEVWYWTIGNFKIVYLWTDFFNTPKDFIHDSTGMVLPSNLAPIKDINILTSRENTVIGDYNDPTKLHIFKTDRNDGETSGAGSVLYLANN